jgi:hypothetical protein
MRNMSDTFIGEAGYVVDQRRVEANGKISPMLLTPKIKLSGANDFALLDASDGIMPPRRLPFSRNIRCIRAN